MATKSDSKRWALDKNKRDALIATGLASMDSMGLTKEQRKDWHTHIHFEWDQEYMATRFRVHHVCRQCSNETFLTGIISQRDEADGLGGLVIAKTVAKAVKAHRKPSGRCRGEQEAEQVKTKPTKAEKKPEACSVCGTGSKEYPPWEGPCSHQLDTGAKLPPRLQKIAETYL